MGIKMIVVVLCAVFAAASASMVNITSQWRADFGWEITCSWRLYLNDSLQSVRLMDHERQFLVYRPELHGPRYRQTYQLPEKLFQVDCDEVLEADMGQCVMKLELYQPVVDDMRYACEVSGERPTFRIEKKDIEISALIPPSDAMIEVAQRGASESRVILNCTSSGLPPPSLLWSVGEQMVPQDFHGKMWNMTSKLWHTWSLLSYIQNDIPATCTPETSKGGQIIKGAKAEYNAANEIRGTIHITLGVLSILILTR